MVFIRSSNLTEYYSLERYIILSKGSIYVVEVCYFFNRTAIIATDSILDLYRKIGCRRNLRLYLVLIVLIFLLGVIPLNLTNLSEFAGVGGDLLGSCFVNRLYGFEI